MKPFASKTGRYIFALSIYLQIYLFKVFVVYSVSFDIPKLQYQTVHNNSLVLSDKISVAVLLYTTAFPFLLYYSL